MGHPSASHRVIGLIGGIGSGKSLVARLLSERGGHVVDADRVGHALLGRPEIAAALARRFGSDILDARGRVRRRVLGGKAFANSSSLKDLNAIVHKPLREELQRRIEVLKTRKPRLIVLDAALLLETNWHKLCDVLVFIETDRDRRLGRVAARRGWSVGELERRENLQKPLDMKRAKADYIVVNNSSVSHLRQQVRLLHQRLTDPAE